MSIDAKLLVLDEPTLGLDILFRKQFYDSLLNDYFDRNRTIVVTTHQVEEIQTCAHRCHVHRPRPHRVQLQHGRIRIGLSGSDGASRADCRGTRTQADPRAPEPLAAASCSSISSPIKSLTAPAVNSSPRSATSAPPASLTCSLPCCQISRAITPARHKEHSNEYAIKSHCRISHSSPVTAPASGTRPFYWSVRRELWEYRFIYLAPLGVGGVFLIGFLINITLSGKLRGFSVGTHQFDLVATPYDIVAALMMLTAMVVNVFYCATHSTENAATAAFSSGNRCRSPTSPRCLRRRVFRSPWFRWWPGRLPSPRSGSCCW